MGGGNLNLKKSWEPSLLVNQEKVWQREKEILEERKRMQQLQKERAEEKQIAELQRLQAAAGGKVQTERVDWMYSAPASGSGPSAEDLEAYLLGKKTVDKLFQAQDEKKMEELKQGAGNFTAGGQKANTARDTANKIREDPLLAIKQQEQAAYAAIARNPARLKALREARDGASSAGDRKKEDKEARRERKRQKRAEKEERRAGRGRDRSYSPRRSRSPERSHNDIRRRRTPSPDDRRRRSPTPEYRRRSRSPAARRRSPDYGRRSPDYSNTKRSPSPVRRLSPPRRRSPSPRRNNGYSNNSRPYKPYNNGRPAPPPTYDAEAARAAAEARLAAMQNDASAISQDRQKRVAVYNVEDTKEMEQEEANRMRGKMRGGPAFLGQSLSKGEGLEGSLRGRQGIQKAERE